MLFLSAGEGFSFPTHTFWGCPAAPQSFGILCAQILPEFLSGNWQHATQVAPRVNVGACDITTSLRDK